MTGKTYETLKLIDLSEIQEFAWSKLKTLDMESIGLAEGLLLRWRWTPTQPTLNRGLFC